MLFKMLCDNTPLTVQQFGHNIVSPKFDAALSFLNLLEASIWRVFFFFFFYDFKNIEHLMTLVNSNVALIESLSLIFCFNGITVNLNEERDRGNVK